MISIDCPYRFPQIPVNVPHARLTFFDQALLSYHCTAAIVCFSSCIKLLINFHGSQFAYHCISVNTLEQLYENKLSYLSIVCGAL
jgi:hypothetical protein